MRLFDSWRLRCCALFLCASFGLATASAEELKSATELVDLLCSKIGQAYDLPTEFSCDVLTAEQRDTKAIIFKSGTDWNSSEGIVWEWDAKAELGERGHWFNAISECKPLNGVSEILVAASSGGLARIRVADKKLLFLANAGGNTHSIALLPDGNIVAASSTGNYLSLFVAPEVDEDTVVTEPTPIYKKFEFFDAHGVCWDAKRKLLWALGGKYLVGYEYVGTKDAPDLKEKHKVELVGTALWGHDLYPAPGYDALMTTGVGVNVFDPNALKFYSISPMGRVKSISVSPEGTTLMQRAVVEWWSETIFYGDAKNSAVGTYDGAKFYKARWFVPNEFSEIKK